MVSPDDAGQYGAVLFKLTGSSCSGKTTAARSCSAIDRLVVHDFDEIGVPEAADAAWRHRSLDAWLQRALQYQAQGLDLLLTGQSPLGEILASPCAPQLDAIAVCLLDVDDGERARRLEQRDPGVWNAARTQSFIGWGQWHREHAADPGSRPEAVTVGGWDQMQWDRWRDWTRHDPRWHTTVIDTSHRTIDQTASDVRAWIAAARADLAEAHLSLAAGWHT